MPNPNTNTQYTGGFHDDPLNSSRGTLFGNSIGGFIDDSVGGILFGDPDWSSEIMGELTGYNSQQREFAMQEYMTDKQNRWNSAQEQMKRAKEAGINPLTAAGGIVGNGTSSAAPPEPSAAGAAAGGLNAASGLVNAITGGKASLAKAALDESTKNEVETLLPEKLNDLRNSANLKFEEVGLTHAQSVIASASAEYADENALRDIQIKRVRVQQMSQEYKNLKAVHAQIMEDINLKIKEAELKGSQKDYYDSLKLKTDEETRFIKADNDFWDLNGFDRRANSNDLIISQMIANGQDPDAYIQSWIDYHGQYQSAVSVAQLEAENDALWDRKFIEEMFYHPKSIVEALSYTRKRIGMKLREWGNDVSNVRKAIKLKRYTRRMISDLEEQMDDLDPNSSEYKNCQAVKESFEKDLKLSSDEMLRLYGQNN